MMLVAKDSVAHCGPGSPEPWQNETGIEITLNRQLGLGIIHVTHVRFRAKLSASKSMVTTQSQLERRSVPTGELEVNVS